MVQTGTNVPRLLLLQHGQVAPLPHSATPYASARNFLSSSATAHSTPRRGGRWCQQWQDAGRGTGLLEGWLLLEMAITTAGPTRKCKAGGRHGKEEARRRGAPPPLAATEALSVPCPHARCGSTPRYGSSGDCTGAPTARPDRRTAASSRSRPPVEIEIGVTKKAKVSRSTA